MASIDNHILTITEPTIKLDPLEYDSMGEGEPGARANSSKGMNVLVVINNYTFSTEEISAMNLDCTGILPILNISVVDKKGLFNIDTFPRDGDVINVRLGTLDKTSYKDIRMDFDIIYADAPPQNMDSRVGRYTFMGRIKVPGMFADECKSYGDASSLDHVEAIANDLKLGVATNIDSTDDSMTLVVPFNTRYDTLVDLVKHSYVDEDSFQTFSIDQYYYVNYVNLNALFNSEETLEDAILAFNVDLTDSPNDSADSSINQASLPLVLSNHPRDEGTNRFITRQAIKNKAGANMLKNGYKRILQYYENDSDEGLVSHPIFLHSSKNMKDIEEPLRGRRDEKRYKDEVKYKYVGRKTGYPGASNTHLNYEYSAIANVQNMDEASKMTLEIELETFNPAIHKYHKLPIVIYTNDQDRIGADRILKKKKAEDNFETEGVDESDDSSRVDPAVYVVDEFLSGYYIVGGIQYIFRAGQEHVKQKLTLLRREWPSRINNINPKTTSSK